MEDSRKRARPQEEEEEDINTDDMVRVKRPANASTVATFESMPREDQIALEKAALLLNLSPLDLSDLLLQRKKATAASTAGASISPPSTTAPISDHGPQQAGSAALSRSSSQTLQAPPPNDNASKSTSDHFFGLTYNYDVMVPWTGADASEYRDKDRREYRNRLMHGFIPADPRYAASPQQSSLEIPPKNPDFGIVTGTDKSLETSSLGYLNPAAGDISVLVDSDTIDASNPSYLNSDSDSSKSVGDLTHLSGDISGALATTNATDNAPPWIPDWPSGRFPDLDGPDEAENNTSKDMVPMTFVSCNPIDAGGANRQKRGPFQNDQLREETNKTRQLKACVRCRMQRIRCIIDEEDPSGSCMTCQNVGSFQKVHNLPCLRYRLTECTEFRTGKAPGMEYSARWPVMKLKDISKWASTEVRTITVKADVSPIPFDLNVRQFVPIPQDSLHRAWMDGKVKKFIETTPFAIYDMKSAMVGMRQYITKNIFHCIDEFLKDSDELVKMTFNYAREYMKLRAESEDEARLLANYMKLWVAVRRTATIEHIIGQDKLGMVPETVDRSYPMLGKVPLPPVMIQQLDIILTVGILLPLQKQVLEDLQKLVLSNNPRTWMTIYLITFMSLHSCATLSAENYRNARRQGFRRRYSFPSFIQERHNSASVFLSYYHYRTETCNPFEMNWKRRHATPFADMSTQDVIFLQKTQKLLEEPSRVDSIRTTHELELYENELYFISQMFEKNWQPRDSRIDYDGGMIHGGPLKKYYTEPPKED